MDPMEKPQCGTGPGGAGEYDLTIHVVGLFLVLGASVLGAGFPVIAKKVPWIRIPPKVFFACKHFGTGVLIATAFVHLLPTAFGNLLNPCLPDLFSTKYPPMAGVIMMGSMFCLFVIEMWLNSKTGGHSHGGPMGLEPGPAPSRPMSMVPQRPRRQGRGSFDTEEPEDEKRLSQQAFEASVRAQEAEDQFVNHAGTVGGSEMPRWFTLFYEQYGRQRFEMLSMIRSAQAQAPATRLPEAQARPPPQYQEPSAALADSPYADEEGRPVDPLVFRKMSLNITLLEGGILFHSVFVGMTVSITIDGFLVLLIAILFHQMFEGLGLGSRIAAVPYPKGSPRPWILVFAFGLTAPIGQAVGLAARNTYDPDSAFGLIIVGVFNAISSGLLLYAALVDLLAEDFLSEEANRVMNKKHKITAFIFVLLGAMGMSIVGAFA